MLGEMTDIGRTGLVCPSCMAYRLLSFVCADWCIHTDYKPQSSLELIISLWHLFVMLLCVELNRLESG